MSTIYSNLDIFNFSLDIMVSGKINQP